MFGVKDLALDEQLFNQQALLFVLQRLLADDTPAAIKRRAGTDDMDRAFLNLIRTGVAR